MRGGKLDTRVRIERATQGKTGKGEVVTTAWGLVTEVWAGRRTTGAVERYLSAQLVAEVDVAFEMRVWPGPQTFGPEERFRLVTGANAAGEGGTHYNVSGVVDLPKRGSGFMVLCRTRGETTAAP